VSFGTWGVYYLNYWVAAGYLIYSLAFYFLIMPFTMCKFCYFKYLEASTDEMSGTISENLMSVDNWGKSFLHMHVGQKGWAGPMAIVWFAPIVLIGISFFMNFTIYALLSLIGFIAILVGNYFYMVRIKCPTCPIQEECHSSF
jgi:hypothetical protein